MNGHRAEGQATVAANKSAGAFAVTLRTFRERLVAGLTWNMLAALSLQGSVLVSFIFVARILGLSAFGAYSILVTTVMTVAAIAQGGSGLVASKYVGESLDSNLPRVARVLRMCRNFTLASGAAAAAIMLAAAGLLSRDLLARPELELHVRLVSLAALFQVLVSYQWGALQGFGAFRRLSRGGVFTGVSHVVLNTAGAWFGGLEGALIGLVAASGVRLAVFGLLLRSVRREHGVPTPNRLQPEEWRMIWAFAVPAGLAGLVTMPCQWLVTILVAKHPNGLAAVALLTAAQQVRMAVLQLPSLLNGVSFSMLSRLKGLDDRGNYRAVFWTGLWMNLLFSTVSVLLLGLSATQVLQFFGDAFAEGHWTLVLLLVAVIPELLATTLYQLVQSAGRMWHSLFWIAMPRDLAYLGIAAAWVPVGGSRGAAAAYLIAQVVGLVATAAIAGRSSGTIWQVSTGH